MKLLEPHTVIDGFLIEECLHAGGMAHIYSVRYADPNIPSKFPMVMKVPRMTAGDGGENIVSHEVEQQILQALSSPYAPRFVAAGDIERLPYLVMEHIAGKTLQQIIDEHTDSKQAFTPPEICQIGSALARATHHLHQQNICHLDLKPANVLLRPDGRVALLDFGLSCHAHFPDLLAEQLRKSVGSPVWIAPEQIVGIRGDARSDMFAIGVILYELATGELAFGSPSTEGGMRQRLWMSPRPVRQLRPDCPEWLQEIILRCLEPEADHRYPSCAHLALDLENPDQVRITARGKKLRNPGFWFHFRRWIKAAGKHYKPSPLPTEQIDQVPILMVAVPHQDVTDATLYSLREAVKRSLGIRPGARLAVITVISPNQTSSTDSSKSETQVQRNYLTMLRQWAEPIDMSGHQCSYHVLESSDPAEALLTYAKGNQVSTIIMGAATHGLQLQRFVLTVPIRVAMDAPCSVILVKQALPFEALGAIGDA